MDILYHFHRRIDIQGFLLAGLVIVVAVLLYSVLHLRRTDYSAFANHMAGRTRSRLQVVKPCPICGSMLTPGERVHTVVYSGPPPGTRRQDQERPRDSMVHMFGCPYCYPPQEKVARICPVCKKRVPADGYVVARMFTKGERKHVHVLGCTECRTVGRKR